MVLDRWWARPMIRRSSDGPNDVTDTTELTRFVEETPDLAAKKLPFWERVFLLKPKIAWITIPLVAALLFGGWYVYDTKVMKGGFFRVPSREELFLYLEMPNGTDIELTSQTLYEFEKELLPIPDGVRMTARVFGIQSFIRVEFEDHMLKTEVPLHYRALLIDKADKTGGSSVFIRGFSDRPYFKGAFMGSALNSLVKITGYNSKRLMEIAEATLARAQKSRRARNARITTGAQYERIRQEEMVISIHRERLAAYGLTVLDLVTQIRRLLGVDTPWSMLIEGEHERVQLAYDDSENISYTDIAEMVIRNSDGERVRLGDLVEIENREVSRSIVRDNQKYTAYVNWEYLGTDQMRAKYIKDIIAGIDLPYGYEAEEARREFITPEESRDLKMALILALIFIFMVLAALFESIFVPILVMFSVPLALVGVVVAFWLTHWTFDSSAYIGLVLLFGIVVNNAILLVNRFRTEATLILKVKLGGDPSSRAALFPGLRKQLGGFHLWQLPGEERGRLLCRAIARATRIRLRSILLTSGTTIVGLAPLLFRISTATEDRDIWQNLALASIGGLIASTVLIILVIPPFYYYFTRLGWVLRRFWYWLKRKLKRSSPAPIPSEAPSGF
jgi:HAE1 family hydrophobic/amphiphilic exporter-1